MAMAKSECPEQKTPILDGISWKEFRETLTADFFIDVPKCKNEFEIEKGALDDIATYNMDTLGINLKENSNAIEPLPFDKLKTTMTPITDDEKIFKKIFRPGSGETISSNCLVFLHYKSYFEGQELPFDSSYFRSEKPMKVRVGVDSCFYGFEVGLMSMKVGEIAWFVIDPEYAYGELGSPPKIPPRSTILLEIEIIRKVVDNGEVNSANLDIHEMSNFSEFYKKAAEHRLLGNKNFINKDFNGAIKEYRKAEKILGQCRMESEEEQEQFQQLMLKIYTNLCIVYNTPEISRHKEVCLVAQEAYFTCPELAVKSAKLLYSLAKAYTYLNDFERALRFTRKALTIKPQCMDILNLVKEIKRRQEIYSSEERETCQKMFGFKEPKTTESDDEEFIFALEDILAKFAMKKSTLLELPEGLNWNEKKLCKRFAEAMGYNYEESVMGDTERIVITKKNRRQRPT